jgi:4-carboxymuconolactone decarboxylase
MRSSAAMKRPPQRKECTMSDVTIKLGGRLPLIDPETLTTTQRDLYDRMDAAMAPWADRLGFQSKTEDGRYIGPFNPILFSPEIGGSFLALQHVEEEHTGLSGVFARSSS